MAIHKFKEGVIELNTDPNDKKSELTSDSKDIIISLVCSPENLMMNWQHSNQTRK